MFIKKFRSVAHLSAITVLAFFIFVVFQVLGFGEKVDPDIFSQLRYRHIGPQGNRMIAVVGVPGDLNVYYGGAASGGIWKSTDGGTNWTPIFDDMPTQSVGSLAIAPSDTNVIWAGTNDGMLHVTRDGGEKWTNVTDNIPNLPPWGTVSNIEPSRHDVGTCYVTFDFHQVNNRDSHIYKTEDFGQSWKLISADIPKSVFSYAHCVREDPVRKGLLYAGTENALYASFNDGANWIPLQTNMPHAPVHWMGYNTASF